MKRILLSSFLFATFLCAKAQTITCAAARVQGTGTVTVTGTVLNGAEFGTSTRYIQDATGGLCVYGSSLSGYQRGDSIQVSGTLTVFNGLLELSSPTATLIQSGRPLPTPLVVNAGTGFISTHEGMLIKVNGVSFSSVGNFAGNTNYSFTQGATTEDIRTNTASNIVGTPIPTAPPSVDVVGVLGNYSGGTPIGTSYQLLVRDVNDIIQNGPIVTTPLLQTNITQSSFTVSFNTKNQGTTIIRYGSTPTSLTQSVNSATMTTTHSLNLTGLSPATIYYVQGVSVNSTNDTSKSAVTAMATQSTSSGDIKIYFDRNVDNSKAQYGHLAKQLANGIQDTLIAYINRAASTLDIAIYNIDNNLGVITAINAATTRGVNVRVICDPGVSSTVLNSISTSQKVTATTPAGGIMHNKFMIMDVGSPSLATVWTGSVNWTQQQLQQDANNAIIIQDQSLARGYQVEFDEMFIGGKFENAKADNTPHEYVIGGRRIEQYFSPTDNVSAQIKNHVKTADYDLYTSVMSFTKTDIAYTIIDSAVTHNGAYYAGIVDDTSGTGGAAPFNILNNQISTHPEIIDHGSYIFHHKYAVIDPNDACSDPMVITGSHNWSSSADKKNDENTLIIHDSTVANIYYQEFAQRYADAGGTLNTKAYKACANTNSGIELINSNITAQLFPNPTSSNSTLLLNENSGNKGSIRVTDIAGKELLHINFNNETKLEIPSSNLTNGIYLVNINTEKGKTTLKWVLSK